MSASERKGPAGLRPGDLAGEITEDLSRLFHEFHQEVEQAKADVRGEDGRRKPGKAAVMLVASAAGAMLTLVLLSFALVFGLGSVMPLGWAALIVGVICGVITAALYDNGRKELRSAETDPRQPVGNIKDDR